MNRPPRLLFFLLLNSLLLQYVFASFQSGLLYWCSSVESGTNFVSAGLNLTAPRTTMLGQQSGQIASACHLQGFASSSFPYTYSNGSAYPPNSINTPYAVNPSTCQVIKSILSISYSKRETSTNSLFFFKFKFQVADSWATDALQCLVPGFGAPNLFVFNNGLIAPTSFPITYDQKNACNQIVFRSSLVDRSNSAVSYGVLYAWKDYSDSLFVTVSLNATGFGIPSTLATGSIFSTNSGQFLFNSPSSFNPNVAPGLIHVWQSFIASQPPQYLSTQLLSIGSSPNPIWSCFTLAINLRTVCDPTTSTFQRNSIPGLSGQCVGNPGSLYSGQVVPGK